MHVLPIIPHILLPPLPQEEMSHALATMRVQEDPARIKKISESKNPLLAQRAKKKSKSGK